MEPNSNFKPRGSFGIPPEMQKKVSEMEQQKYAREQEAANPQKTSAPTTEIAEAYTAEKQAEAEAERQEAETLTKVDRLKKALEEELGVSISEEDIRNYIFKGVLRKEIMVVRSIGIKATFQTLNTAQMQEIDKKMSVIRAGSDYTSTGIGNENSILTLSYGWLEAAGKSLGATPAEREVHIRQMAALFVEQASEAFTNYNVLVKIALQDKGLVKKS